MGAPKLPQKKGVGAVIKALNPKHPSRLCGTPLVRGNFFAFQRIYCPYSGKLFTPKNIHPFVPTQKFGTVCIRVESYNLHPEDSEH